MTTKTTNNEKTNESVESTGVVIEKPAVEETPEKEKATNTDEVFSFSPEVGNYFIVAAVFFAVGLMVGIFGFSRSGGLDEAAVERIVRDAIADADLGGDSAPDRFALVDDDPYLGQEDAAVVIVEFSDFRCPYCGRHFEQTLQPLLDNYGEHIRYVYRDFASLSPESVTSAMAAQCAHEQGKYWEFHNALFTNQERLGRDLDMEIAENLNLDLNSFMQCINEERYLDEVQGDRLDGRLNNVSGTPGFFINGQFISGAQPYEIFERVIQRELNRAGIQYDA